MKYGLTDRQMRFVREYAVGGNATQAAIVAGYSVKSAKSIGHENLTKPDIRAEIQRREQDRYKRLDIKADLVLSHAASMAFSDIGPILHCRDLDAWDALPARIRAGVASAKHVVKENGDEVWEFRMHPKGPGVEQLMKHLGLYAQSGGGDDDEGPQGNIYIFEQGGVP